MAQNRFKAFLKDRQPFGDSVDKPFVIDAAGDPALPDPKTWEELEAYIKRHNPKAPTEVLDAAKYVWGLYESER